MLEMPNPHRKGAHGPDARMDKDRGGHGGKDGAGHGGKDGVHHTEEYWKSSSGKTKADWVKEEEGLNRGHRASESFAVLNELVVVRPPYWRSRYAFSYFPSIPPGQHFHHLSPCIHPSSPLPQPATPQLPSTAIVSALFCSIYWVCLC